MGYIYQYLATYSSLIIIMSGGMHYAWPSPSLPILLNTTSTPTPILITSSQGSLIAIMELIGGPIGSIFVPMFLNIVGRKMLILSSFLPFFASWLMVAYAKSVTILCLARLLAGMADGVAFTAIPIYIGEIAHPSIRGLLGSSISSCWILGMLLINITGSFLDIKAAALIASIFPLIFVVTFVWMPESPYFLIMRKDFQEARQSLKKFNRNLDDDKVEAELARLIEVVETQMKTSGKFLDLFTQASNRKALIILAVLRNGQQLSGTAAISFYTLIIFQGANNHNSGFFITPEIATFTYVAMQMIMAGACSVIVDKTGRRLLLFISLTITALTLASLGTFFYLKDVMNVDMSSFSFVPIIALLIYVIAFNFGTQPIPLLMQGELFPTNVKAFASCLSEVYFCALASTVSKLFQVVNDRFGMFLPFYIFSFCCVVNLVFVAIFVPETKGKTLEEIQIALISGTSKSK